MYPYPISFAWQSQLELKEEAQDQMSFLTDTFMFSSCFISILLPGERLPSYKKFFKQIHRFGKCFIQNDVLIKS